MTIPTPQEQPPPYYAYPPPTSQPEAAKDAAQQPGIGTPVRDGARVK